MKSLITSAFLSYTADLKPCITLILKMNRKEAQEAFSKLQAILDKGKLLWMELKQWKPKRSLDANGMLWSILHEMAAAMNTTKDELYLIMLERYGIFTHVVVKPNVVERVKAEWRTVRELGEVTINGQTGIQLQCYFGSHSYDSKEFSVLLNGVISEAQEIGIDTISESEKESLIQSWKGAGNERSIQG